MVLGDRICYVNFSSNNYMKISCLDHFILYYAYLNAKHPLNTSKTDSLNILSRF